MTSPGALVAGRPGPARDEAGMRRLLAQLDEPVQVVRDASGIGVLGGAGERSGTEVLAEAPAAPPETLGDPGFRRRHGVARCYAAGAMAGGIATEELVIALGRDRVLGSFGAAGLLPDRIEAAIARITDALPCGPYAFNLIHSPAEEALERRTVELYLAHGVRTVEAAAFLTLTPHVVRYRVAGLSEEPSGAVRIGNRVIAKVSRREVARHFLSPPPPELVAALAGQGLVTARQAELAARVPMADDVTVEADSAGHTDNRPLVVLLPSIVELRDELQARYRFAEPVGVGAAGGIGTPHATLAAFVLGAGYVVTGSVNQSCVEAAASAHTKRLLAEVDLADVAMAPAADMFELGVRLQVVKRGTLFPVRAQRLYALYRAYDGLEQIPADERARLERQVFRQSLDEVWRGTREYFAARDPAQVVRAEQDPKRRMALVFRWYLGRSSRWSNVGEPGREGDYQIWCGPAMGAFNDWVRGSHLADPADRRVVDVARHLMTGAAYLRRVAHLDALGVTLPAALRRYRPEPGAPAPRAMPC
ncbi:PfaD family polyunsaturated fatty acid/polyketide biosynthesis protein [Actinoallomurus sp. CA-142502]|uniref:PfaD family polyunsaturated fatty acid/polyketide biosynthesis protein n=1 Tax=Actinoallomurus sp. CA-142502 TaxID=3239885 RepID=UPI003D8F4442